METKKHNEVTNFMYFMLNVWNESESIRIFGDNLGRHIFEKWLNFLHDDLRWYGSLDNKCRQKIVDAANEYYKK